MFWLLLIIIVGLFGLLFIILKFKAFIIVILTLIAMFLTNPTKQDFTQYYNKQIARAKADKNILEKVALEVFKVQGEFTGERTDLKLFSIYDVNQGDKEIKYIGIFKLFFVIYSD